MRINRSIPNALLKTAFCLLITGMKGVHCDGEYGHYLQPVQEVAMPQKAVYGETQTHYVKPEPYSFGYDLKDGHGNTQFHKEDGDVHGIKRGAYGYTDAHGIYRYVEYIADALGFRAVIKTNEPGTANQHPSHVEMHVENPPRYDIGTEHHGTHYNEISYHPE